MPRKLLVQLQVVDCLVGEDTLFHICKDQLDSNLLNHKHKELEVLLLVLLLGAEIKGLLVGIMCGWKISKFH